MLQEDAPSVQHLPACAQSVEIFSGDISAHSLEISFARALIEFVSQQRMAQPCQVCPDLVKAAGSGPRLQQRTVIRSTKPNKFRHGGGAVCVYRLPDLDFSPRLAQRRVDNLVI